MMSDMAFLPPSPWLNDFSLAKDGLLPENDMLSDLPFDVLDHDAFGLESLTSWEQDWDIPSSYQSSEISVANSECSDEQSVDIDGDLEDALLQTIGDRQFLSSAAANTRPESSHHNNLLADSIALPEFEKAWSDDDDEDDTIWDPLCATDNIPTHQQREKSITDILNHSVQWSSLNEHEKSHLVEDLSAVVSKQLGLREQLEVIQIINPCASVSPTDTEFVIDLACLNDEKLEQVYAVLRQHMTDNTCNHDSTTSKSRSSRHHGNQSSRLFHHHHNTSDNESTSGTQSKKTRKRTQRHLTQQRRSSTKQKRARQQMKEQRSGLFTKEQIVAVESTEGEELDDVDILT